MINDVTLDIVRRFLVESQRLNGHEVHEREPWQTHVTADAIRHVAHGISDENPLWLDADHAGASRFGRLVAPPVFLCSVLYPVLHGAPVPVPLSNLIVELGFQWHEPLLEGDVLRGAARQVDATESRDRHGRPLALILSEVEYRNQRAELVGKATATLARVPQQGNDLRVRRGVHSYIDEELRAIGEAQRTENRRGARPLTGRDIAVGDELPPLVRGPLTIGDMICWQAAIGPSYRPGAIGYRDTLKAPHSTVVHPVTGWPVKDSQQHEDFLLSPQRGMPVPFDNGVMRLGWIAPLLTSWMGDDGWLEQLTIRLLAPNLYGDTTWYRGTVSEITESDGHVRVAIEITGANQLGNTTTAGEAVVRLPVVAEERSEVRANASSADLTRTSVSSLTVCDRFARQVDKTPDAVAVVFHGQSLTYSELNARATTLAHRLVAFGLRPHDSVGICLPRSSDWIVATFGVLKAGGTFVPLDPTYPRPRLEAMIEQVQPRVLLTSGELHLDLPVARDRVLLVESETEEHSDSTRLDPVAPEDGAYVVFTSGTTGTPNGVVVSHGSLGTYVEVMRQSLGIRPADVYLHTASFCFSASMRQVFTPLCTGAPLVVADEPQRLDPSSLFELMRDHDVTIWDTVPSVFRHAIETLSRITLARRAATLSHDLRLVVLTGEALNWALPAAWRKSIDHPAELINLYSHSETAGTVSMYPIPGGTELGQGEMPLGWPVEGSTLYVLDSKRRLLPEGEVGELWVGGNRLADGYVGRPELTAERFVCDPFRAGGHMYRTGDRGRLRADGAVEFVGRIDDRLNVRGHRIEPADVERALREHPAVSQALVSGKVDPRGDTRLVAYVVPVSMASPTVEGQLRYELPNHLAIAHVHKHETDFTYRAIYEDQTYLKHGITYADGDCIFDVGANIGLLSLFVHLMCARPRIYAFEPNPPARDALMANMRLYGVDSRVFPCGLSHEEGQGLFTTFEGFSLLSGLHADVEEEKKLVRAFMNNQANEELAAPSELEDQLEQMLEQHFVADNFEVPLRSLSSVIEDEEIERIDFLKINVEKSEWDVLRGVRREHWPLIHQVVIKVDLVDKLAAIVSLLESCGLDCVVDQDETMTGSRVHTVYAVRPSAARRLIREQSDGHHRRVLPPVTDSRLSRRDLREFLVARLPDHMTPSVFVLLESLPLNSNGKLNRAALPEPDWSQPDVERPYAPPACPIEQELGRIWCEVLGVARVGRHDHFLDLGGDSIKAVRMINRVRDHFHAPLPVTAPFRAPTVAGLAREILAKQNPGTEV